MKCHNFMYNKNSSHISNEEIFHPFKLSKLFLDSLELTKGGKYSPVALAIKSSTQVKVAI